MGYYTQFELEILEGEADPKLVARTLSLILSGDSTDEFIQVDDDGTFEFGEEAKWYDHDEDMISLTKAFPGTLFCLSGKGEEAGDMWKVYYRDGTMQICRAQFSYPPYDANKMTVIKEAQESDMREQEGYDH
jgi:hypothetical protein